MGLTERGPHYAQSHTRDRWLKHGRSTFFTDRSYSSWLHLEPELPTLCRRLGLFSCLSQLWHSHNSLSHRLRVHSEGDCQGDRAYTLVLASRSGGRGRGKQTQTHTYRRRERYTQRQRQREGERLSNPICLAAVTGCQPPVLPSVSALDLQWGVPLRLGRHPWSVPQSPEPQLFVK